MLEIFGYFSTQIVFLLITTYNNEIYWNIEENVRWVLPKRKSNVGAAWKASWKFPLKDGEQHCKEFDEFLTKALENYFNCSDYKIP